jgi:hypothetical protein
LGLCERCNGQELQDIYMNYIKKIALHIQEHYPGMKTVMWDDVYRAWPLVLLRGRKDPLMYCKP